MLSQKKLLEYLLWFACSWNHDILKGALSVSLNGWSMWFWMDLDSSAGLHIHSTCSQLPPITPISWFHFVDEFSLSVGSICSRQRPPWARAHMPPASVLMPGQARWAQLLLSPRGAAHPQGPALCLWCPQVAPWTGVSLLPQPCDAREVGLPPSSSEDRSI